MKILVTGCAGFIGSNLCDELISLGYKVIGVDNFNDYYNPKIKEVNLKSALTSKAFKLYKEDILSFDNILKIFKKEKPDYVVHLAARAGVRPSIVNPKLYSEVNVLGTVNLLKLSVDFKVKKFIFGSSSSVYGNSLNIPFSEEDLCLNIISPYGSSKRKAEFWVESFYHSYGLNSIILRFFTVYGPRGRVDMAPSLFAQAILKDKEILRFGDGLTSRDYTYVSDIVEGIIKSLNSPSTLEIINLGNNNPITLIDFIKEIEVVIGKAAKVKIIPQQAGDVERTWADVTKAKRVLGWVPKINITSGLKQYIEWLK